MDDSCPDLTQSTDTINPVYGDFPLRKFSNSNDCFLIIIFDWGMGLLALTYVFFGPIPLIGYSGLHQIQFCRFYPRLNFIKK